MSKITYPCKECHTQGNNYLGCHDSCEKYLEVKRIKQDIKDVIRKADEFESVFNATKLNYKGQM